MEKLLSFEDQAELLCKLLSEKTGQSIYYVYTCYEYELPYIQLLLNVTRICTIDSYFDAEFVISTLFHSSYDLSNKDQFDQFVNDFVSEVETLI